MVDPAPAPVQCRSGPHLERGAALTPTLFLGGRGLDRTVCGFFVWPREWSKLGKYGVGGRSFPALNLPTLRLPKGRSAGSSLGDVLRPFASSRRARQEEETLRAE